VIVVTFKILLLESTQINKTMTLTRDFNVMDTCINFIWPSWMLKNII